LLCVFMTFVLAPLPSGQGASGAAQLAFHLTCSCSSSKQARSVSKTQRLLLLTLLVPPNQTSAWLRRL